MLYAKVIINISAEAVDRAFTYAVPDELADKVRPGMWVRVPFGKAGAKREGVILDTSFFADFDESRIKSIDAVIEKRMDVRGELISLAEAMAGEYSCTLNQALKTVLPIKRTVRKNSRRTDPVARINSSYCDNDEKYTLSPEQEKVYKEIISDKRVSLLYGVTGSGKTLIYIELIKKAMAEGKESIVLIPEISLTYQTVGELTKYLGSRVAVIHSRLSEGERFEQFKKAESGEISVMVGPRSAVFTPFENLGLIIIDEEHEKTYRSDTAPRYDARWVAAVRAGMNNAKLVLGSATPSLKSYKNAEEGIFALHTLKNRAVEGSRLPAVHIVDMRNELMLGNRSIFSRKLKDMIDERLDAKEQVMLFLNRRGFANFVSCRSCGKVLKCPRCDVSLTVHNEWVIDPKSGRKSARLCCHYCGHTEAMPGICPDCSSKYIAPFGAGTQKLELNVRKIFPKAGVLRMDADTTSRKGSYEKILSSFKNKEADILIGTQMIVKGHDFPNVTLVGIVSADLSLNSPDYDAAERTFGLITQAAGRSGRGEIGGDVVIQTYEPSHYAITSAAGQDYPGFYERELSYRRLLGYPPEVAMLFFGLRSKDEQLAADAAGFAAGFVRGLGIDSLVCFGPVNENIYKIKDYYRKILYVKHESHDIINKVLNELNEALKKRFPQKNLIVSADIM